MAYTTSAKVRDVTGLTTTDIADADLDDIITLADKQLDSIPDVTFDSSTAELASTYLCASLALRNLASKTMTSPTSYSLGRLRVDNKSVVELRMALAQNFMDNYNSIVSFVTDGTGIKKIQTD